MALLDSTSSRIPARAIAISSEGVCSILSAFGQEAVHVPHWIQRRMLSPPGIAHISSTKLFTNSSFWSRVSWLLPLPPQCSGALVTQRKSPLEKEPVHRQVVPLPYPLRSPYLVSTPFPVDYTHAVTGSRTRSCPTFLFCSSNSRSAIMAASRQSRST